MYETGDGDNQIVRKRPGRTSYTNIVLKRGFTNTDELWVWRKAVVDGRVKRKSSTIILCDDAGGEIMRYNFFEAWPCRWKSSMLSAQERETVFEEIEIVVEKIERG